MCSCVIHSSFLFSRGCGKGFQPAPCWGNSPRGAGSIHCASGHRLHRRASIRTRPECKPLAEQKLDCPKIFGSRYICQRQLRFRHRTCVRKADGSRLISVTGGLSEQMSADRCSGVWAKLPHCIFVGDLQLGKHRASRTSCAKVKVAQLSHKSIPKRYAAFFQQLRAHG